MTDFLEEYKAYYRTRKERYENNSNYQNTFQTENAMYEAMNSCNELIEFKDKLGDLNEKNAVSLIKDQYTMRQKHYSSLNEAVRVLASDRILSKADSCAGAQDVITLTQEEENKNSVEISMDEMTRLFLSDSWPYLDDINIYSNAVVPSSFKNKMINNVRVSKERLVKASKDLEKQNRAWDPNWTFDTELILEERHLRLSPYKLEFVKEKLQEYKKCF